DRFGEVVRGGRTPGKRYLGIRVVRDDGGPVRFTDSVVRNALRIVDMLPGYYAVGIVAALLSKSGKRLGDMAAGTVVVRDAGDVALPDPETLLRPEALLVKEYLDRRPALTPAARYQVGVELLALYGESPQPGWDEPVIAGRLADLAGLRVAIDAAKRSG
ncbi:MAG: RDD family protein, partial [Coriobacteriia bacterium]|nr:RDD family protein [Coriobacteriia bacterium]